MTTTRYDAPAGQWFPSGWRLAAGDDFTTDGVPLDLPLGTYRWVHLPVWSQVGSCVLYSPTDPSVPEIILVRGVTMPLQGQTAYQVRGAYASFGVLTLLLSDDPTASPAQLFPSLTPVQAVIRTVAYTVDPIILPPDNFQLFIDARDVFQVGVALTAVSDNVVVGYQLTGQLTYLGASEEGFPPSGSVAPFSAAIVPGTGASLSLPNDNIALGGLIGIRVEPFPPSPGQPITVRVRCTDYSFSV